MLTQSIVIPAKISFSHEWNIRNKPLPTESTFLDLGFLFSGSVSWHGREAVAEQFSVIPETNSFMTWGHTTGPSLSSEERCGHAACRVLLTHWAADCNGWSQPVTELRSHFLLSSPSLGLSLLIMLPSPWHLPLPASSIFSCESNSRDGGLWSLSLSVRLHKSSFDFIALIVKQKAILRHWNIENPICRIYRTFWHFSIRAEPVSSVQGCRWGVSGRCISYQH